jgi:WD40 repeat protein
MDAYIIRYGPEGYIGAPEIERIQAWHSADQLLVLNGFVPEQLNEVLLNTSEAAYLAMPGRDKPWFEELDNVEDPPIKLGENLEFLFDKLYSVSWLGNSIDMKIVGEERIAERKVWIVAVTGNGKLVKRLWVDCLTGRILRYQEFYENNPNLVENEFDTHAIEYDVDFPQELFDPSLPWRGGFARDHTGAPLLPTGQQDVQAFEDRELLPLTIKPPDFNPALSQLSIQLPSFFSTENGEGGADLFSDRYYIGTITFDDPWNAVCDRSTDGRMLALATNQSSSPVQGASLRWYDLSKDNFKEHNFRLAYTNQFAFSPDGNQLAIFGYNNPKDSGWIFVLDTRTQVFHRLMRVEYVRSLAWSPDGTQLAFIGSGRNFLSDEDIIILNIESEKVTYRASIDFLTGNGDNDWPMTDWGIEFPVEMKNLAECVKPPT